MTKKTERHRQWKDWRKKANIISNWRKEEDNRKTAGLPPRNPPISFPKSRKFHQDKAVKKVGSGDMKITYLDKKDDSNKENKGVPPGTGNKLHRFINQLYGSLSSLSYRLSQRCKRILRRVRRVS